MFAASGSSWIFDMVPPLLKAGADVNAQDAKGRTALDFARTACNSRAVAELLKAGAKGK